MKLWNWNWEGAFPATVETMVIDKFFAQGGLAILIRHSLVLQIGKKHFHFHSDPNPIIAFHCQSVSQWHFAVETWICDTACWICQLKISNVVAFADAEIEESVDDCWNVRLACFVLCFATCLYLVYVTYLLLQERSNPRVRCALGNVYILEWHLLWAHVSHTVLIARSDDIVRYDYPPYVCMLLLVDKHIFALTKWLHSTGSLRDQ